MNIYNAPTSFYTISSNQTDDQSFDSTVSALVIEISQNLTLESEYDLASTHSINSYSRYFSLRLPPQRLLRIRKGIGSSIVLHMSPVRCL